MISKKIQTAINNQIQAEISSAHIYLQMSAWFQSEGLSGFANWMMIQYKEELAHAVKFFDFLHERGGKAEIKAIEAPKSSYKSALEIFETSLEHEQKVTKLIYNLYELAREEKDYAFESFLKWFIDEQVEEENSAKNIIDRLSRIPDNAPGLIIIDQELAKRKK